MTHTELEARIAEARVQVAKSAIAHPEVYPAWGRLRDAKAAVRKANADLYVAQRVWDELIEAAPDEWKKLAPIPE